MIPPHISEHPNNFVELIELANNSKVMLFGIVMEYGGSWGSIAN
ncbi:MAG: hypothetical protein BWY67_02455 [Bacteroidetes bacterium ADurb.Bin397]|nr:MAG: hypothetical protein BWY67_02455 [Bacteroidetes bacterium ADurb.Bin397]